MLILGFGSLKSRDCDMGICTSSYIYTPLSASVSVSVSICICISVSIYRYQYTHLHICDWVLAPLPGGGDVINVREKKVIYVTHSCLRGRAWYLAHRGRRINIGSRREGWRSKKGRWVVREKKEENERKREKERQRKKKR